MKISVLGSGSSGNCTYFETNHLKCLIDLGTTSLYATTALKEKGIDPDQISCIFITHEHTDHIAGLKVFLKKHHPTIYLTQKLYDILKELDIKNYVIITEELHIEDLKVSIIKTSHDAKDSVGYVFESNNKSLVYITDTGYINSKYFSILKDKTAYVLESNHDINMLMEGSYPYHLKQRILGDYGHLSNESCYNYLTKFVGEETKYIFLAHISENNNTTTLAYETNKKILETKKQINILVTSQHHSTELVEI